MLVRSEVLERLRSSVQAGYSEWSAMLETPRQSYVQAVQAPQIALSEYAVEKLAKCLEITPESVVSGNVDFKLLARRASGHATALPEKYSQAAYSRVRTSAYLLDYVEMTQGWQARERILRHFQMNESIISDQDLRINIRFLEDLCEYLSQNGSSETDFTQVGKFSAISNSTGAVARLLRKQRSPAKAYEHCFTELIQQYYDRNFLYRLHSLNSGFCILDAFPNRQVVDELRTEFLGNPWACAARAGGFASIMAYLDLPDAKVRETACIHRGDSRCRYEIDFSEALAAFKTGTC